MECHHGSRGTPPRVAVQCGQLAPLTEGNVTDWTPLYPVVSCVPFSEVKKEERDRARRKYEPGREFVKDTVAFGRCVAGPPGKVYQPPPSRTFESLQSEKGADYTYPTEELWPRSCLLHAHVRKKCSPSLKQEVCCSPVGLGHSDCCTALRCATRGACCRGDKSHRVNAQFSWKICGDEILSARHVPWIQISVNWGDMSQRQNNVTPQFTQGRLVWTVRATCPRDTSDK